MKKIFLSILSPITIVSGIIIPTTSSCTNVNYFTTWNENANSLNSLITFVETDAKDVPIEDRIAVFDFDGTVYGELAPFSFHWTMLRYRVPNLGDKATSQQTLLYNKLEEAINNKTGVTPEMEEMQKNVEGSLYSGMTVKEYREWVANVGDYSADGFTNVKYSELFYKPMLEIIQYLKANQFTVYFVTGSDTYVCRTLAPSITTIPENRIFGSYCKYKFSSQDGGEDWEDYDWESYKNVAEDKVVRCDDYLFWNLKANKIKCITDNIGKQPILSFGNSSGDYFMSNYTMTSNKYPSKAFMVINDDNEREYGGGEKIEKVKKQANDKKWVTISMKDDWKTIYGYNVTKSE